jgi:hypothetical protein
MSIIIMASLTETAKVYYNIREFISMEGTICPFMNMDV